MHTQLIQKSSTPPIQIFLAMIAEPSVYNLREPNVPRLAIAFHDARERSEKVSFFGHKDDLSGCMKKWAFHAKT